MTGHRALVLGAAGFIGRHVTRALARSGCEVVGIGHGNWTAEEAALFGVHRWIEADITFDALMAMGDIGPITCVVHCAGSGVISYSFAEPWQDFQRATVTTAAVLEWVRRQAKPRPRIVLVSSAAVYGDQGESDASETAVRSPISPYGFHKFTAEILCESSSRFFELPISIVRLFSVYGEGLRKQLLWDALNKFSRGEHQFFGTGNELRDWIHVDDAAALLALAGLAPQSTFEVYNGGAVHATTRQLLEGLARAQGYAGDIHFNGEVHKGNPRRLTSSCGNTSRRLNWVPQVPLEDGLTRYATWFRSLPKADGVTGDAQ